MGKGPNTKNFVYKGGMIQLKPKLFSKNWAPTPFRALEWKNGDMGVGVFFWDKGNKSKKTIRIFQIFVGWVKKVFYFPTLLP